MYPNNYHDLWYSYELRPADTVVDCYYPFASELTVLIVGLKNIFGFGFGYAVIPWINRSGVSGFYGALAGIQFGTLLLGLPLWFWGKRIRHITAKWKLAIF
jgi:hypothetical protein